MSTDSTYLPPATLSRRALVMAGLMGSIAAALPHGTQAAPRRQPGSSEPAAAPEIIVYDRRTLIARQTAAMASAAAEWGLIGFDGDVTDVWSNTLQPLWAAERRSVAGLSTPAGLFCIEQMAATYRMRVAMRCDFIGGAASSRGIGPTGFLTMLMDWKTAPRRALRDMMQLPASQQVNGSSHAIVAWLIMPTREDLGRTA